MNGDEQSGVPHPDQNGGKGKLLGYLDIEGKFSPPDQDKEDVFDVDVVLIQLKTKEIEEQIRSNKVIEGVLRDIHAALQTIADKE